MGCGLGVKERTPRQRGGEPRGRLRDIPSHESGDITPPESDKPPYTHDREGFLLGELVDHGLDTLRNATTSRTSMRSSLKTSSVDSGARRLPTTGAVGLLIPIIFTSCSERFSDVFITNSRRFRPAPAANLVSCATSRFPEHARGKRNPEDSSFRASSLSMWPRICLRTIMTTSAA